MSKERKTGRLADPLADEAREAARAERPELVAREDREAELARRLEVLGAVERAAQARLHRRRRLDQLLLDRPLERRAVEVALAEVLVPRVAVRVELDERERPVLAREHAQLGERDRVVAAESEREDAGVDERRERLLDLAVRALGVARRDRHVAVVDDRERLDDVDVERRVVRPQQRRRRADRLGAEARARPVARRRVERDAVDGRVHAGEVGRVRRAHERPDPGEARHHPGVERPVVRLTRSRSAGRP